MTLISTCSCTVSRLSVRVYDFAGLMFRLKGTIPLCYAASDRFTAIYCSVVLYFAVWQTGFVRSTCCIANFDIYGWHGLWIVQTITFFPYAYAIIYRVINRPLIHLEYAAYNLGATRWQVFRHVFLPLCRPGIAGGALIAAMDVLADFGNPIIIGGNFITLPTEAYMQMSGLFDLAAASVLSTALLLPGLALFLQPNLGRQTLLHYGHRQRVEPEGLSRPIRREMELVFLLPVHLAVRHCCLRGAVLWSLYENMGI